MNKPDIRISGKDLKHHLESAGVSSTCPTCGHEGMSISVDDPDGDLEGNAPAVHVISELTGKPGWGYGQYLQVCNHCGFIRYFRDIEVLAFLNSEDDNE